MLRQKEDRDCSVPVFSKLARISEEELLLELPHAKAGQVDHHQWLEWLRGKNLGDVRMVEGCPTDLANCAHLVSAHQPRDQADFHWIYRDEEGDVQDPSSCFAAMPADDPRMKSLEPYPFKVLTIVVSKRSTE